MTTKIKFPGDASSYEKIVDSLPMTELAFVQKMATRMYEDDALLMTETVNALKEKFEQCMRAEFNAVNKFIFCTHEDSDLAMIFELKREYVHDAFKVNISLCVKKKFGSKPVAKADIVDAAKKLYRHAFAVLAHPTIKSMTKTRDIENEVHVPEPLWKKVKGKDDNVSVDSIVQAVLDSKGYQMQELKTALKKEVIQNMDKKGAGSFKPVIEDMIDNNMTNFLSDVSPSLHDDPVKTLELMRTKMEQHLTARPDAVGKSMEELAHLEIIEALERHRERMHANAQEGAAGAKEKKE